jgi:outer membrane protein W
MKAFLLTAATFLAFAGSVFAQNLPPDYYWEVGVNGGTCGFTRPLGPAINYQGTRTNTVPDLSVRLNYYFNPHWMINLDIGSRKWVSYGTWQLNDLNGVQLKTREITFLIADKAINESVGMNYVIPFYTRYNTYNKANINFGVQVGLVTTVNDGSLAYSKYKSAPDSNYTYMSRYDYGNGIGLSYGIQMGVTYYFTPRLGVNLDLAMRYASVKTHDTHYGGENNHFYLLYFPETIGLRWRF